MNARKTARAGFDSRPLLLQSFCVAALTFALACPAVAQNLGQRSFCGGTPAAANSLGALKVRWTTSLELYFTPSLSHPAPGINDPNNPASIALPEQRADTVQYLPSAGTPERVVFSRTVVAAGHTLVFNGDFRPAFASYPGRAVLDVQIDGGPGVRYLQDDISDMQFTAELTPPPVSGVCKGEQWYSKLTLRPTGGPRSTQITGTWRVVGPAEYAFAPNQGTFDFTADPNKFEASIGVTNTTLHAGSRQFTVEVGGTSPDGCRIEADQAPVPVSLHVQTASCALTGVDFEAGQTVGVPIEIVNPCVVTLRGTWTLSGGEAYYNTPKSEQFAIPPKGRLRKNVPVRNTAQHGAPVTFTFSVQPVEALPCSSTAAIQFQPPRVTVLRGRFFRGPGALPTLFCYYLRNVSMTESVTATVDWRGHPPGDVVFDLGGNAVTQTTGGTAQATIAPNMGTGFGVGDRLRAVARSTDTSQSRPLQAELQIVGMPPGMKPADVQYDPNFATGLKYTGGITISGSTVNVGIGPGVISAEIPGLGGTRFGQAAQFLPRVEVAGSGTAKWAVKGQKSLLPSSVADRKFDLVGGLALLFKYVTQWKLDGGEIEFGASASMFIPPEPKRFCVPVFPPACVPVFVDGKVAFGYAAIYQIVGMAVAAGQAKPEVVGQSKLEPSVEVMFGVGVKSRALKWANLFVEVFLRGFASMTLQFGPPPPLKEFRIGIAGGLRARALIFSAEFTGVTCQYDFATQNGGCTFPFLGFDAPLEPMPRDYIAGEFDAFHRDGPRTPGASRSTSEQLVASNVFPQSDPDLTTLGSDLLLVRVTDDPNRPPSDRTKIVSSRFNGATWSAPQPVADDGTCDFHPRLAALGGNRAVCVWEDSGTTNDPNITADELINKLEIVASIYEGGSNTWGPPVALTSNTRYDGQPQLRGASDGTAMVAWLTAAHPGSEEPLSTIHVATFDGSNWSAPAAAVNGAYDIVTCSLAYRAGEAAIVFVADTDGDFQTMDDHELFGAVWDGATWSAATRLTFDAHQDQQPQVAFDSNDDLVLVWYRDGSLVSATDLGLPSVRTVVESTGQSSRLANFRLATGPGGAVALVWQNPSSVLTDIYYSVFDAASDAWTLARPLLNDDSLEHSLASIITAGGELALAYNKVRIERFSDTVVVAGQTYTIDDIPRPAESDVYVLRHDILRDLSINPDGIALDPPNPAAGASATITATVTNAADLAASNIQVGIYDGDPNAGGVQIGSTQTIAGPLAGGDSASVSVAWTTPSDGVAHDLVVIIDPAHQITESDESNNQASRTVLAADLAVTTLVYAQPTACSVDIDATVTNRGALPAGPFDVTLRSGDPNGPVIATLGVVGLAAGASADLTYLWVQPDQGQDGEVKVYVTADEAQDVADFDREDNTDTLVVNLNVSGAPDCNRNGIADACDILFGYETDTNNNGIPDSCERLYVDAVASGASDGSSWADAFTKLHDALAVAADPNRGVQEVWVAAATYRPADPNGPRGSAFALPSGVRVYGGFASGETSLAQRDPNANPTILSGDLNADDTPGGNRGDNAYHVVVADNASDATVLDGFVVRGGAADAPGADERGGGIRIENGAPTIRNCLVVGNEALSGGGVSLSNTAARLVNCALSGNAASENGGAVWVMGGAPALINCTLAGNTAVGDGGGLWTDSAAAALTSCILWGNGDQSGSGELAQVFVSAGGVAVNYTCIQGLTGGLGGTGNLGGDPLFVNAAGVDGVVGTPDDNLRLAAGSPCIDAGDSLALPADADDLDADADTAEGVPIDLAGRPRRIDDPATVDTGNGPPPVVDLGAYEHQPGRSKQRVPQHQQAPAQL